MATNDYWNKLYAAQYTNPSVTVSSDSDSSDSSSSDQSEVGARAAMLSALTAMRTRDENLQYLKDSMKTRSDSLKSNYDDSLNTLKSDYTLSKDNINSTAADSLKQAYINNMMSQKNLTQKMANQGLTGGATESTIARLMNAYGNNRNTIDTQKGKDLSSLENTYTSNKSKALQDYNNALAALEQENQEKKMEIVNTFNDRLYDAIQDYGSSYGANSDMFDAAAANIMGAYGYGGFTGNSVSPYAYYLTKNWTS